MLVILDRPALMIASAGIELGHLLVIVGQQTFEARVGAADSPTAILEP